MKEKKGILKFHYIKISFFYYFKCNKIIDYKIKEILLFNKKNNRENKI